MPCDSPRNSQQTAEEREREIIASLRRLEAQLTSNQVSIVISPEGAVCFAGWADRDGVSDVCAYHRLMAQGSFALANAIAQAEMMSGRQVNPAAVGSGVHSHDGGHTWHPGH